MLGDEWLKLGNVRSFVEAARHDQLGRAERTVREKRIAADKVDDVLLSSDTADAEYVILAGERRHVAARFRNAIRRVGDDMNVARNAAIGEAPRQSGCDCDNRVGEAELELAEQK